MLAVRIKERNFLNSVYFQSSVTCIPSPQQGALDFQKWQLEMVIQRHSQNNPEAQGDPSIVDGRNGLRRARPPALCCFLV